MKILKTNSSDGICEIVYKSDKGIGGICWLPNSTSTDGSKDWPHVTIRKREQALYSIQIKYPNFIHREM